MSLWNSGEWFINQTWFLWPAAIWLLATSIFFLAWSNIRMSTELKRTRIDIMSGIEKILNALAQETNQLRDVMIELKKDNFLLKDTTNKLTEELSKTRVSIDTLHGMWKRFLDYWGYPK